MYHLIVIFWLLLLQDLEGEREVNKEEVLEYCNSSDVNVPLIETSAKVCSSTAVHFRQYLSTVIEQNQGGISDFWFPTLFSDMQIIFLEIELKVIN